MGWRWLLSREVVVTLAVLGALATTIAPVLLSIGRISAGGARLLNRAGYALMFVSIVLFLAAGLRLHG